MNAKKCKSLRRLARTATVGQPQLRYVYDSRRQENPLSWTRKVSPLCTRGTYLAMKRGAA